MHWNEWHAWMHETKEWHEWNEPMNEMNEWNQCEMNEWMIGWKERINATTCTNAWIEHEHDNGNEMKYKMAGCMHQLMTWLNDMKWNEMTWNQWKNDLKRMDETNN